MVLKTKPIGSWGKRGKPNAITYVDVPVQTMKRLMEPIESGNFPDSYFDHNGELEMNTPGHVAVTYVNALAYGRNTLCWYSYQDTVDPNTVELKVVFPHSSRVNLKSVMTPGLTVGLGNLSKNTKFGFALISDSYFPEEDDIRIDKSLYFSRHEFNNDPSIRGRFIMLYDALLEAYVFYAEDSDDFDYSDLVFYVTAQNANKFIDLNRPIIPDIDFTPAESSLYSDSTGVYFWFSQEDVAIITNAFNTFTTLKAQMWLDVSTLPQQVLGELSYKLPAAIWDMSDHSHFVAISNGKPFLVLNSNVTSHDIDPSGVRMVINPKDNLPSDTDISKYEGMKIFITVLMHSHIYSSAVLKDENDNILFQTSKNNFSNPGAHILGGRDL